MKKVTKKIIKKVIEGDAEATELLINEIKDLAYYLSCKTLGDKDLAKDCAQEMFIKVLKNIKMFNSEKSKFKTWVYTLFINHIKNYSRDKKIVEKYIVIDEDYTMRQVENKYNYNTCCDVLTDLEKYIGFNEYNILYLRLGLNYKFKELAVILNMPESTVKRKYNKAIALVKKFKEERINE